MVDILNYKNLMLFSFTNNQFILLQNIYEIDTGGVAAFDTLIKVRPELNSVINGIILIDDEIPSGTKMHQMFDYGILLLLKH